jgi:hypothetical protein
MTHNKIIEKLYLLRCSINGNGRTDNEKSNAKTLYNRLLLKYSLTDEDIKPPEKKVVWFHAANEYEKHLLVQIICATLNIETLSHYYKPSNRYTIGVELTKEETKTIKTKFEAYRVPLHKEIEACLSGFVHANKIFSENSSSSNKKLSEQELAEIEKILNYMQFIKKTPVPETNDNRLLQNKQ